MMTKTEVVRAMERVVLKADRSNAKECMEAAFESAQSTGVGYVVDESDVVRCTISIPKTDYECKEEACVEAREQLEKAQELAAKAVDEAVELRAECERLRHWQAVAGHCTDRLMTIADEAFGMQPTCGPEESMTRIERGIASLKRGASCDEGQIEELTKERDEARAALARIAKGFAFCANESADLVNGYFMGVAQAALATTHDEAEPHHGE